MDNTTNGGDTGFNVTASDVTIDGFTVQGSTSSNVFGPAIFLNPGTSGSHVVNNIIQNSYAGLFLTNSSAADQTVVQHDLFQNNTAGLNTDIYTDQFTAGVGGVNNVLIDSNTFTNTSAVENSWALGISNTNATPFTNITFSNNTVTNHGRGVYFYDTTNSAVTGNTLTPATTGHYAVGFFDSDSGISVTRNLITTGANDGVEVFADSPGQANSNLTVNDNSFSTPGGGNFDVYVDPGSYTGTLDASGNWWNTTLGTTPTNSTPDLGQISALVSGTVTVGSFLNSGANTATVGFTPAAATEMWVPQTTATTGNTVVDGNIQSGINTALSGMIVRVAADTYAENVVVNKSVTLIGANNTNPVPGRSGPETIVEPGLASSFDTSSVFVVEANDVTIEGFTIQGSIGNPPPGQSTGFTLTSGVSVYAAAGVSNSTNINTGGSAPSTTDVSGLTVQNNIVQDFTQVGVYGDTSNGTVSTGNTIADNLITDVPNNGQGGYFGEGVLIYDNFYADVTGNKITKARTGIQTGNNYLSAGAFAPSISNNTVSAYVKGVYFNLQYGSASTFTVSDNTITQADATVSLAYNVGLLIQSIQSSVQAVIQGNNVSGFLYGVEFAGNNTTNTVTVRGGDLNANTYGVWDTNNDYFYPANYNTTAALDGVTITNSTTAGVWVDSTSPNSSSQHDTTDSTTLSILDGTTITGGPVGLLVDGALSLASLQQSTISGNAMGVSVETGGSLTSVTQNFITGNTGDGIRIASTAGTISAITDNDLSGNAGKAVNNGLGTLVDASLNWWGSNTRAGVQAAISGSVDYTPFLDSGVDTQPATPGFQGDFSILDVDIQSAQVGGTGRIQEGVNDVLAGGTVNVLSGTYPENVVIAKNLTLAGAAAPLATIVHPAAGDGITIMVPATNVTVKNLEVTGATNGVNASGVGVVTLQNLKLDVNVTGLSASTLSILNLSDLTLTGNTTAGGTISNISTVNYTPRSGTTGASSTITASSFRRDADQAVNYSSVPSLNVFGSDGSDTFDVTPSAATTFAVHGALPTPQGSPPGDTLIVELAGTTKPMLAATFDPATGYSGGWTFSDRKPVNFDAIEQLAPTADLSIAASGPATATIGDPNGFDYILTVTNNGASANTGGFTVKDTLPAGETFQAVGSTPGATVNGQMVTYTNGAGLANGATQTFTIHVTVAAAVPPGTVLQDSATVTPAGGATIDPNSANNTSNTVSTTVTTLSGAIVVNGTNGDDTLIITASGPDSGTYSLNGGPEVPFVGATSFTFNGLDGNDTLIVHNVPGGVFAPANGVIYVGGPGINTLTVDAAGATVHTGPGQIFLGDPGTISYSGVATINLDNAASVHAIAGPDTVDRATAFIKLTAQERFVQALYLDELDRAGTKAELDGWVSVFGTSGLSQTQAQAFIAGAIEHSAEARDNLARSWYVTYLGRQASGGEEQSWVNALRSGQKEESVLSIFLGTQEFYDHAQTLIGTGTANERFVQALYLLLLNRTGEASAVSAYVNALPSSGRQGVAASFLSSAEFRTDQFEGYYDALLHRPSDSSGLNGWVFSNLDMATVRVGFESSGEFFANG